MPAIPKDFSQEKLGASNAGQEYPEKLISRRVSLIHHISSKPFLIFASYDY